MPEILTNREMIAYATEIASSYLANNDVSVDAIPEILKKIFFAVIDVTKDVNNLKNQITSIPAVPVEESVFDDYIICLEDGKKLQMLKRHLSTVYNMTVEEYKEKWGLPQDYPVVSLNYAKRRSDIAKNTGLGSSKRKKPENSFIAA
ncbi:MAG: MucR family transcriptional regulator [Holosporales bacterium]|jgi:predicted transcriptional regulator|nr:MucR family transcriptional regulator [Holosporales bacterium]